MKALPPAPSQLELLSRRHHALTAVEPSVREPSVRQEILRALAEVLLAAAGVPQREGRDEAR